MKNTTKTQQILKRIEQQQQKLNLSDREASKRATGHPYLIRTIRKGSIPSADKLSLLAEILQCSVSWLIDGKQKNTHPLMPTDSNVDLNTIETQNLVSKKSTLPVYCSAQGGPSGMVLTYDPIEYVKTPSPLLDVKGGFGMYVVGDSMEPVYRQGDLLLIHPTKPAKCHDDILIIKSHDNLNHHALVKRLKKTDDKSITVEQFNPYTCFDIELKSIQAVQLIVGCYRNR